MWIIEIDNMRIIHQIRGSSMSREVSEQFQTYFFVHLGHTDVPRIENCHYRIILFI